MNLKHLNPVYCVMASAVAAALPVAWAAGPAVTATSNMKGFYAKATDTLPAPARKQAFSRGHFCAFRAVPPKTAAGKAAQRAGWYVSSEAQAAGYTAVGIFSRGEEGTSGACFVQDGNVVLYKGTQPVAIVYADRLKEKYDTVLGAVGGSYTPNRLRIDDGGPASVPQADIVLTPGSISVEPIASSETVCGLTIPRIANVKVTDARKLLAKTGWRPDPSIKHESGSSWPDKTMPELSECSGTGYGFCNGAYRHKTGAVISITSWGDEPTISSYDVTCPKK